MGDGIGTGTGCPPGSNRGGGPKTAEGLEKVKANFTYPPEEAPLKHQGHRFLGRALAPSCGQCIVRQECEEFREGGTCVLAERAQEELLASLLALPHILPQDEFLCREYAKWATFCAIVDRYLSATSPFLPGSAQGFIDAQPILKQRSSATSLLTRLASELGLTPAARKRLSTDVDRGPVAELVQAFAAVAKEDAARKAAVVDAEFEAEDQGADGGAQDG